MNYPIRTFLGLALACSGLTAVSAQDVPHTAPGNAEYSPYPEQNFPNQVFFGDTHLHTSYSTDAGLFGNKLGPDEAYRFAKGEMVESSTGVPARLDLPLDFLVIADHAENLGLSPLIEASDPALLKGDWGRKIHDLTKAGKLGEAYAMWGGRLSARDDPLADQKELVGTMWQEITSAAERHNTPGSFTALIGFEWTSSPSGNNLHRNVVFRDDKSLADQIIPFSAYDSEDPEDLWAWMAEYEKNTGGKLLALAHNGNLSNGLMFDDETFTTKEPLSRDYAERRMRWEPLYEVTQMKGDGETHPSLSPDDEFADFETWDKGSFGAAKEPGMIPREYAREALKRGLTYEVALGINPFKFGMVGSTDSHTSLATTQENNFFGKVSAVEPTADPIRFGEMVTGFLPDPEGRDYTTRHYEASASGLAAVWARENTREAIWDSMKRKEVFATSGTRMRVRLFGGWSYTESDLIRSDFAAYAYDHGVPMGGDLPTASAEAPTFLIQALRDPNGANLDRIQIIKGWTAGDGESHETVYDVVCGGGRVVEGTRCAEAVGNTVNVEEATYDNSIGSVALQSHWSDPDFDSSQRAFYYVRVLEIPTPRWTTIDAKVFGVERPTDVPDSIQERAYTSPIWYTPES